MRYRLSTLVTTIIFIIAAPVSASVVLTADVTDPTAVTITSTTATAANSGSGGQLSGLTLLGFFDGNTGPFFNDFITNIGSGAFSLLSEDVSNGSRDPLDAVFVGDAAGGFTADDLNFYNTSSTIADFFARPDTRAVEGDVTVDLSTLTGLPSPGTIGDVIIDTPDAPVVIGQYEVIPEPTTAALLAFGGFAMMIRRRRMSPSPETA